MPGLVQRPLTARSVLASTLLGTDPPRLPVSFLVRTGALFDLAEGTVRTALSRMVSAGEVIADGDGWYSLSGELVQRQRRQASGRAGRTTEWSGRWRMAVVEPGARQANDRAELRTEMQHAHFGELRDGVWLRPDNLDPEPVPTTAGQQCRWFRVEPELTMERSDVELAEELFDLDGWSRTATALRREMQDLLQRLEDGDHGALVDGFVLSAAVLRHFVADPLLPRELLSRNWPGPSLRRDYDRYDRAYRALLYDWSSRPGDGSDRTTRRGGARDATSAVEGAGDDAAGATGARARPDR